MNDPGQVSPTRRRRPRRRRRRRDVVWLIVPTAMLAAGGLVLGASNAAFTATTQNTGNTWTAGTVTLSDSDAGTALFTASNVAPGWTDTRCIQVTYSGNLAAEIRTYGVQDPDAVDRGLYPYLDLVITRGTGTVGANNSCSGYTVQAAVFSGTATSYTGSTWASALGAQALTPAQTVVYQVTATVQAGAPNAAQLQRANFDLVWEARTP